MGIKDNSVRVMLRTLTPEEKEEMERIKAETEKYEAELMAKGSEPITKSQESIAEFVPQGNPVKDNDIIGHPNHYCEGREFEPKDVIRD